MEGYCSPVPDEIPASETEVPWPEATAIGSSSGGDSGDWSEGGSGGHDEESGVVDPHKAERSYNFGLSTVTVTEAPQKWDVHLLGSRSSDSQRNENTCKHTYEAFKIIILLKI
jgi:hypothetical protein